MWFFSTGGFLSAVEHRDDKSKAMVRARDKKSLEEMLSGIRKAFAEQGKTEAEIDEIMVDMGIYSVVGDYKWRAVVPKSAFALFLAYETMHYLNYANFKSKLTATRGQKWHDTAMKVWSAMFGIEDRGVKTGNPDVDNPKPFTSFGTYEEDGRVISYYDKYPSAKGDAGGKVGNVGSEVVDAETWQEGEASGGDRYNDWMDDAVGVGYYDSGDAGRSYRWNGNSLFSEELDDYDEGVDEVFGEVRGVPSGTGGYHTFSGRDFGIDGRGEIVDGRFIGASFFEDPSEKYSDVPTDAELEAVQLAIDSSWERWDEETEYNTVTGETRSTIVDEFADTTMQGGIPRSVLSMTDSEWNEHQSSRYL